MSLMSSRLFTATSLRAAIVDHWARRSQGGGDIVDASQKSLRVEREARLAGYSPATLVKSSVQHVASEAFCAYRKTYHSARPVARQAG